MHKPSIHAFKNGFSLLVTIVLGLILVLGLLGCSSDDDPATPTPMANATGYYEGTAAVKLPDNSNDLDITDLKAFVNGDHILIMSAANVLLYELKGISIANSDYSATVNIYKDGTFLTTTTVTGVITEGISLRGTFAGLGAGNGSFDVAYSSVNDSDADLTNIPLFWSGSFNEAASRISYEIDTSGQMTSTLKSNRGVLAGCALSGEFTVVTNENLYSIINMELSDCDDLNVNGTNYTGLATTIPFDQGVAITENGIMPIAFSNGDYSGTGEIPID